MAGIPGLLLYLGLLCRVVGPAIRATVRTADRERICLATGLVGAITAYLVSNQFNFGSLGTTGLLWAFLGLLAAMAHSASRPAAAPVRRSPTRLHPRRHRGLAAAISSAGAILALVSLAPPMAADAAFAKGWVQTRGGDISAFASFAQANQLAPGEAHYYEGFADVLLATALAGRWRPQEETGRAVDLLNRAIRVQPRNAQLYVKLGDAEAYWASIYDSMRLVQAEDAFRLATELAPGRAVYYQHWGDALLLNGEVADALPKYERAVSMGLYTADLYGRYAQALLSTGQTEEADAAFATYQEIQAESSPTAIGH